MTNYYSSEARFYVSVDCIIFGYENNTLKVLLKKRNFEPFKGEWSLMGGFVKEGENVDDAAERVLTQLTGIKDVYMQQVGAFGRVDRDPADRVISIVYYSVINIENYKKDEQSDEVMWADVNHLPMLHFGHKDMIDLAKYELSLKIRVEPIGFKLLPDLFTLTQLQNMYETIMGEEIDKRNFRKKINDIECIKKTDKIDKKSSKRGAYLYKYDEKAYTNKPIFKL